MISARFAFDAAWTTSTRTELSRTARTNRNRHRLRYVARRQCYRAYLTIRYLPENPSAESVTWPDQARRSSGSYGHSSSQHFRCCLAILLSGELLCYKVFGQAATMARHCSRSTDLRLPAGRGGAKEHGDAAQHEKFGSTEDTDRHVRRFPLRLDLPLRSVPLPPDGRLCSPKPPGRRRAWSQGALHDA